MKPKSSEIFIPGPAGRLEGKYYKNPKFGSPVAIVLQPHPQYGGSMNNKIVQLMYIWLHQYNKLRYNLQKKQNREQNPNEISQEMVDKEVELISEELKNSGKPDEIVKKISFGKINKFKDENSLMTQDWVMDPKLKVKDVLKSLELSNLEINEFIRLKIGE